MFILIFLVFKTFLTSEKPLECIPFDGIAKIKSLFFILLIKIFFFSTKPTEKPARSNLPGEYVPGISAVSPPTRLQLDNLHPLTMPLIISFIFFKLILSTEM